MTAAAIEARLAPLYGQRFGALRLVSASDKRGDRNRLYGVFVCNCGKRAELAVSRVTRGIRTHCGCLANTTPNLIHGMRGSPAYSSWQAMKARCLDPDNKDYPRWGGIGITVCDQWVNSFEAFYKDMGPRPTGTTIDRIDNTRGYEPGNCRWATATVQQSNRRDGWCVEIDGVVFQSVQEAARALNVSDQTIMRWCDGHTDARRAHQANGGRHAPRPNCRRWKKYGP